MEKLPLVYDPADGAQKALSSGGFVDEDFDATNAQTEFNLSEDIDATTKLDVFADGRLQREGASYAFQRDATNNRVTFTSGLLAGVWVRVRIYNR